MLPRFFSRDALPHTPTASFPLDAEAAQHVRVRRLATGDALVLFDGHGGECAATIREAGKRDVVVDITGWQERERESPLDVTIAQALAPGDKMDWVVQKATELGVRRIVPFASVRSVAKLDGERADKRRQHWQGVAIAACEQCGRNRVPEITPVQSLADVLAMAGRIALLSPRGEQPLLDWARADRHPPLILLIGPEGGFAPEEAAEARRAGAALVRFGPRVLRTETAGMAALAALQTVFGDLAL